MQPFRLVNFKGRVELSIACICVGVALVISLSGCRRLIEPTQRALSAAPDTVTGRVVKIADGDTITVLDDQRAQHKIRLLAIDAPERSQAFGQVSRANLANLVFGKMVTVEYHKLDKYGRIVGKVLLDGRDICLDQVRAGLAWHYKQYERDQDVRDRAIYANAEAEAHLHRTGLWQDANPTPPWDFRHNEAQRPEPFD